MADSSDPAAADTIQNGNLDGTNGTSPAQPAAASSSSSAAQKVCAHCNKPETSSDPEDSPALKPCIACKSVLYCSRDCKKNDLKKHKKVCAKLAQEYMKTADVKMASRAPPKADTHRGGLQKWQFDT